MENNAARYFSDIRKSKPLSSAREVELAIRIQDGDQDALNELVEANLKFVVTIARKYQGRGLEMEDLIAEGNTGLIEAAQHFDPKAGFKFISYGVWWIRQAILSAISNNKLIRLPMNKVGIVNTINKVTAEFREKEGRNPSDKELAKAAGVSIAEIRMMQNATRTTIQLDKPMGDDGDSTLDEVIADPGAKKADISMIDESLVTDVDIILKSVLSEREADVIRFSYGIGETELSDEKIGEKFGISGERIRQIKYGALNKLRKNRGVLDTLRDYL